MQDKQIKIIRSVINKWRWSDVMIWDVLDRIHKNFTEDEWLYTIDVEIMDAFWEKRSPLQFQWPNCIEQVYNLVIRKHPHLSLSK